MTTFIRIVLFVCVAWRCGQRTCRTRRTRRTRRTCRTRSRTCAPARSTRLFFGDPEIAGAQLSPDGQYIAFLKPCKDTRNVWVKKAGEPFDAATAGHRRDEAARSRRTSGAATASTSSTCRTRTATRTTTSTPSNPAAAPAAGQDVPAARNVTDAKGARAIIYATPKTEPDILYVGLNDRDTAWHDLYKARDLDRQARRSSARTPSASPAGSSTTPAMLRLADARRPTPATPRSCASIPTASRRSTRAPSSRAAVPSHFHKDGKRVYLETSKGEQDLSRLVLFDPATGKEEAGRVRSARQGGLRRRASSPR